MAFLIGQCCSDEITGGPETGTVAAPINERYPFTNVATLDLPWTSTRIAKYGVKGAFKVWVIMEDGALHQIDCDVVPNDNTNPTSYHFDFGGLSTGEIIIY